MAKTPITTDDDSMSENDMLEEMGLTTEAVEDTYEEGVDPNHPILTVAEQRQAIAKAQDSVAAAKKKAAMKALEDQERERLMGKAGQSTGDPIKDELVYVSIDLPEFTPNICLNMKPYWHGQTYKEPRHVADTLREQQSRAWNHQTEIDGKSIKERFRTPHNVVLSGKAA